MFWFLSVLAVYFAIGILVAIQSLRIEKNNPTWRHMNSTGILVLIIIWPFYFCCDLVPYYWGRFAHYIIRLARQQSSASLLLDRMQKMESEMITLRCETVSLLLAREAKEVVKETFEMAGAEVVGVGLTKIDNRYGVKINLKSPSSVIMTNFMGVPVKAEVVGAISAQKLENNDENERTS